MSIIVVAQRKAGEYCISKLMLCANAYPCFAINPSKCSLAAGSNPGRGHNLKNLAPTIAEFLVIQFGKYIEMVMRLPRIAVRLANNLLQIGLLKYSPHVLPCADS